MASSDKTLRTCDKGHSYFKSSDCPVCPICEKEYKPKEEFLSIISAPARRALEREGIFTLLELSKHSEADLLKLHGLGPGSLPKLRACLEEKNLSFKEK